MKIHLLVCIPILLAASCAKDVKSGSDTTQTTKGTGIYSINVPNSFNWNISHQIDFNVIGLTSVSRVSRTLTVKTDDGKLLLSNTLKITDNFSAKIIVPLETTLLVVEYGTILKNIPISNNKATFDYLNAAIDNNAKVGEIWQ